MSHNMPNGGVVMRAIEPEDLDFLYSLENDIEMWMVGETNVPYSRFGSGCSSRKPTVNR